MIAYLTFFVNQMNKIFFNFLALIFCFITNIVRSQEINEMPMPVNYEESAEFRWLQKPVLESRLLSDMEKPDKWIHQGFGEMSFTEERAKDGKRSVRLTFPTVREDNPAQGGGAGLRFKVNNENWSSFNRLSFWVYPTQPGFPTNRMIIFLRNHGDVKVPDMYRRDGAHFVLLKPNQWNHVVWEIENLARDKVTGIEFAYHLGSRPPGGAKTAWLDIDHLELQKVDPDHYEGWNVASGKITFSPAYKTGLPKSAFASEIDAQQFSVIHVQSGKTVITKPIEKISTSLGEYQLMNFSELRESGNYFISAGEYNTKPFSVDKDAWKSAAWKIINFMYCERCGMSIPGIHGPCHGDLIYEHGDKKIVVNGGWHDAGDLSQMITHTAPIVYSMFDVAEKVKDSDFALYKRLIEEARWGLDYILKTRFGDGYRITTRGIGAWTDGIIGTGDDRIYQAKNTPFENFVAAAAEVSAWRSLKESDPLLSGLCLKNAEEDWHFAVEQVHKLNVDIAGIGGLTSIDLYNATGSQKYLDKAIEFADCLVNSQEKTYPDWGIPLTGFLYKNPDKAQILRYNPRSQMHLPVMTLVRLCNTLPDHHKWMDWYSTVVRYSEYLKSTAEYTQPYGMIPSSIYAIDEKHYPGLYSNQENIYKYEQHEKKVPQYVEQVKKGVKLGEKHYLKRFPVWYSHRGNFGIILAEGKALTEAAHLRKDLESLNLGQMQLEWILGRNPFCQSTMYGEGYDYAPLYSPSSGDMVGSLPVGIRTRANNDEPYWPTAICYNYKEVWVEPVSKFLWIIEDITGPAEVTGQVQSVLADYITFLDIKTKEVNKIKINKVSKWFNAELPEGEYIVSFDNIKKRVTLLPGKNPHINFSEGVEFSLFKETSKNNKVKITANLTGNGYVKLEIRADNLKINDSTKSVGIKKAKKQSVTWEAEIVDPNSPWVAVVIPDNNLLEMKEIISFKKITDKCPHTK